MADSNITKRALAAALKELMEEVPFSKISVANICERCHMNRKSFYYHFKDKYDLVNWIFDTEFLAVTHSKNYTNHQELLTDMCEFFYANRSFYKKALSIQGQNSFSDHFKDLVLVIITESIKEILPDEKVSDFQMNFLADATVIAFQRWITDPNPMSPSVFLKEISLCLQYLSARADEFE